ncbi:MAG: fibronectin type III domain-containing protein [Thermoplasmatota archaeon]
MKGLRSLAVLLILAVLVIPSTGTGKKKWDGIDEDQMMIQTPELFLHDGFMENLGQLSRKDIRYYTTDSYRAGFIDNGVVLAIDIEDSTFSYEMVFKGCNHVEPVGLAPGETEYNFLTGSPEDHVKGAHSFSSVLYPSIYDGIDIKFHELDGRLKYDIIVSPGASPEDVVFEYVGIDGLDISPSGDLVVRTIAGDFLDRDLIAYQGSELIEVDIHIAERTAGFRLGDYDRDEELVIDPFLEYSTRVGGTNSEGLGDSLVEMNGALYFTGSTYSVDFPITAGAYDSRLDSEDTYVAKVSMELDTMLYATYLGGRSSDYGHDIAVDGSGCIYVTGVTYSTDFPTTEGVLNETSEIGYGYTRWGYYTILSDGFVTKISSDGSSLDYSTFITGNKTDTCVGIEVDSAGNAYVCGVTESGNFRTKNAYQDDLKGYGDVFIMKIDPSGTDVSYSTFIGGNETTWYEEYVNDIDLDDQGRVVICGYSGQESFPTTTGAYKTNGMWEISFVAMLTVDGSDLEFSTYIDDSTYLNGVNVYPDGIYLTGYTYNSAFPVTSDAYDNQMGGWSDVVFIILKNDGSNLIYSTLLGGSEYEYGDSVRKDEKGQAVVVGYTYSTDFPKTANGYTSSSSGTYDIFVTQFKPDRKSLNYSSAYGGTDSDYGMDSFLESSNEIYVLGYTYSSDYPTTPGSIKTSGSQRDPDAVISKFKLSSEIPSPPRSVAITNGNMTLNITWMPPLRDGNETLTNYSIYRADFQPVTFKRMDVMSPETGYFLDTGLVNGERYFYYVTAENIVGEGLPSKIVSGVPAKPPGPTEYILTSTGDRYINITWDFPVDDGGDPMVTFNVYAGTEIGSLSRVASNLDRTWFNHTGLVNGQIYHYRISSVNSMGEGALSRRVQDYPARHPGPPLNLRHIRGDHFVHLFWNRPSDDGGDESLLYTVLKSGDNVTFQSLKERISATEYNITGLENGETWIYAVLATNSKGSGEHSNIVQTESLGIPSEPLDLVASAGDGFMDLEWDPPESFGGTRKVTYRVYLMVGGEPWSLYTDELITTELRIGELKNGIRYDVRVTAVNIMGEGLPSMDTFAIPIGLPSQPQLLNATLGDESVRLSWMDPADMGGEGFVSYVVFMGTLREDLHYIGTTTSTTFMITDLRNGQEYFFAVVAVNSLGQGELSSVVSAIPLALPGIPEIRDVSTGDSSLTVRWKDLKDKGGSPSVTYRIYLWKKNGTDDLVTVETDELVYEFTGLENGIRYEVALSAYNQRGEGSISEVRSGIPVTIPGGAPMLEITPDIGSLVIGWGLPSDNGGGEIETLRLYKGSSPDQMLFYTDLNASAGHFVDRAVTTDLEYYYSASCVNSEGEGPASEPVSARPLKEEEERSLLMPIVLGASIGVGLLIVVIVGILLYLRIGGEAAPVQNAQVPAGGMAYQQAMALQGQGQLAYPAQGPPLPPARTQVLPPQQSAAGYDQVAAASVPEAGYDQPYDQPG